MERPSGRDARQPDGQHAQRRAGCHIGFQRSHDDRKLHPVTRRALDRLWQIQRNDGGRSAASLFGDWDRWQLDESEMPSNGYGTGFVIYVARQCGIAAQHQHLQRGIAWTKKRQRQSSRWFTASIGPNNPYSTNRIATAGTAFVRVSAFV